MILSSSWIHMGFMLEQLSNPLRCFYKALAAGTAGADWCWIPVGNTPRTIQSLSALFQHEGVGYKERLESWKKT